MRKSLFFVAAVGIGLALWHGQSRATIVLSNVEMASILGGVCPDIDCSEIDCEQTGCPGTTCATDPDDMNKCIQLDSQSATDFLKCDGNTPHVGFTWSGMGLNKRCNTVKGGNKVGVKCTASQCNSDVRTCGTMMYQCSNAPCE
jgi:hypothetical protein